MDRSLDRGARRSGVRHRIIHVGCAAIFVASLSVSPGVRAGEHSYTVKRLLADVAPSSASWAPDSETIVVDDVSPHGLRIVSVRDGTVVYATDNPYHNTPTWIPGSAEILFQDKSGEGAIRVLDSRAPHEEPRAVLASDGFLELRPRAVSQNGKAFVYSDTLGISVLDFTSGMSRLVVPADKKGGIGALTWSADSNALLASRRSELIRINLNTGRIQPESKIGSGWFDEGPDGELWFRRAGEDPTVLVRRQRSGETTEYKMPGAVRQIDVRTTDGAVVVAVRGKGLFVVEPETGSYYQVTSNEHDREPLWSPDGTQLAFVRMRPSTDLYVVRLDENGE